MVTRRNATAALVGLFGMSASQAAVARQPAPARPAGPQPGLDPASAADQSPRVQALIDAAARDGRATHLPPGRYRVSGITLRENTSLVANDGPVTLVYGGGGSFLAGRGAHRLRLVGLTLDGAGLPLDDARGGALVSVAAATDVQFNDLTVQNARGDGFRLEAVSGRLERCRITGMKRAAVWSIDAAGLVVTDNAISDCADNGILVWRTRHGTDGTRVTNNRIDRITGASGGTGQYGNGVNIYRAADVMVSGNRITACTYSAVRANEASNVQIFANSAARIGEVALYVEAADERAGAAGFEGAVVSNNVVDGAAAGIVVTNYNNGGRLAVVQGNLVRNLQRREHESVDKRGEGIAVEADAVVSGNVIENAPTCGIMIGWGRHMREVVATGNLIRRARIGIAVSADAGAGRCLIAQNMISDASDGAIRAMDHARPIGPDLLVGKPPGHIVVSANTAG